MDDELPRLAILGAGPVGLEAALYARYLGYPVEIMERGSEPAQNVRSRGEGSIGTFAELASTLGVAALRAQNPDWQVPRASELLTVTGWWEKYLLPLAQSDLIADVLRLQTEVLGLTRDENSRFQIRCRDVQGEMKTYVADIVIDATGAEGSRDWFPAELVDPELSFLNPDADYYVLGGKCQTHAPFTIARGLAQIRELFAILGEREDLDIYATLPPIA